MATTPNLGLYVVSSDDTATNVMDWVQRIDGIEESSNAMKLDAAIAQLQSRATAQVIFSASQPSTQVEGDTWNEILSEV